LFEGKDEEVTTALESDNTRLIELHQETLLGWITTKEHRSANEAYHDLVYQLQVWRSGQEKLILWAPDSAVRKVLQAAKLGADVFMGCRLAPVPKGERFPSSMANW